MTADRISVAVEEQAWKKSGVDPARIRAAARLALANGLNGEKPSPGSSLTILLANDETLRALNSRFRGKDVPTNVLAFPAAQNPDGYLGDVAIAFGVAERESTMAGRPLLAHTLHLTVHGVLHLLGYDHVKAREAKTMECMEIAILHELGVPSPYGRAAAAE